MVQSQKSSVKQKKTNKRDPSAQGAGAGGHCAEVGATLGKRRSSLLEEDQRSYPLLHWPLLHLLQSNRASSGRWRGSPIFSSGWRTPACPLLARQSQQRGTGGQGDTSCGSWTQHLLTQLHPPARSLQPNPPGEGHTITQLRFGWSRVTFWASRSHLWGGKYQIVGVTITLGGAWDLLTVSDPGITVITATVLYCNKKSRFLCCFAISNLSFRTTVKYQQSNPEKWKTPQHLNIPDFTINNAKGAIIKHSFPKPHHSAFSKYL